MKDMKDCENTWSSMWSDMCTSSISQAQSGVTSHIVPVCVQCQKVSFLHSNYCEMAWFRGASSPKTKTLTRGREKQLWKKTKSILALLNFSIPRTIRDRLLLFCRSVNRTWGRFAGVHHSCEEAHTGLSFQRAWPVVVPPGRPSVRFPENLGMNAAAAAVAAAAAEL